MDHLNLKHPTLLNATQGLLQCPGMLRIPERTKESFVSKFSRRLPYILDFTKVYQNRLLQDFFMLMSIVKPQEIKPGFKAGLEKKNLSKKQRRIFLWFLPLTFMTYIVNVRERACMSSRNTLDIISSCHMRDWKSLSVEVDVLHFLWNI